MRRPPGMLRAGQMPDIVMMICTAGHVDHGKTALVRLLTGCNTDRLKAEKERGLTIELGFAPCVLGGEIAAGIVDVPGHEKFVRTMVAGVSGIDLAILVVAADDGLMPQTVEHLQIMELMGVRNGIVALTKTDLVTHDKVLRRTEQLRQFLAGTFLNGAPICPLSSETGDGVFEFYEMLAAKIRQIAKRPGRGVFRMPIERSFVQKGFGAVVTGIPVDGEINVGDEVELVPAGETGHIRGIQRFLRDATHGGYGQCLALNIPEFGGRLPGRGQVLCRPGYLAASTHFYASLRAIPGLDRPLANAEPVKFHAGTAEQNAKVYLLQDDKELTAGHPAYALIVVAKPVPAAPHDRFILRRLSPPSTIAGGEILMAESSPVHGKRQDTVQLLREVDGLFRGLEPAAPETVAIEAEFYLRTRAPIGMTARNLAGSLLVPEDKVAGYLRGVPAAPVIELAPDIYIHNEAFRARMKELNAHLDQIANKTMTVSAAELRKNFPQWPQPLWNATRDELVKQGRISAHGARIVLKDAVNTLAPADQALLQKILALYEHTRFSSPRPDQLPERVGAPKSKVEPLLKLLCDDGRLVRLAPNVVLSYNAAREAQEIILNTIKKSGTVDSADFKYAIGSSRKYALAILDYFDARRITVRNGNLRRLAPDYERSLLK